MPYPLLLLLPLWSSSALPDSLPRPPRWGWYGGVVTGLAKPSMRVQNNFTEDLLNPHNMVEPFYLRGQNVDARVRPLAGVQLGLEAPGRRWALHAESTVRRFGGYRQQFVTGHADFPTKTYSMQATALASTLGLRYQQPVRGWRLLLGAGLSYTRWLHVRSGAVYDGVSSRELDGFALPVRGGFMRRINSGQGSFGQLDSYEGNPWGTYLEAGLQHGGWSLVAAYRRGGTHEFEDASTMALRQHSRLTGELQGFLSAAGFYATPRAWHLTLGYRLYSTAR